MNNALKYDELSQELKDYINNPEIKDYIDKGVEFVDYIIKNANINLILGLGL